MTATNQLFIQDLKLNIKGNVLDDDLSRGIFSTDASIYQITPLVIVLPKDENDIVTAVKIARDHNIPMLPRGGATSLAGQTVGKGMVLDFTKYMNGILDYNAEAKWVRVQPGIVRDELNAFLKKDNLEFAPDPATSSRAAIGGMVANNSSGTKSVLYGKTIDHVTEMKVLLPDGTIFLTGPLTSEELSAKMKSETREAELYRELYRIVNDNEQEIRDRYPKTMRRVGGYCLDELLVKDGWMLGKILIGSEGTLGIILEIKLNLVELPKYKSVAVVQFNETITAIRAVATMLKYQPAAVEILSRKILEFSKKNIATSSRCGFIKGDPEAIQIVEFYGDTSKDVIERAEKMCEELKGKSWGYEFDVYPEGKIYNDVWSIRKKGLGLLLGEPDDKKAVAFIEDAAIPINFLPEYIEEVMRVCEENETDATYYAHASVGVIHVRPILDLREKDDIEKMKRISEQVFALVKKYGGSWSSEHGDGLVRSPYQAAFYGEQIYHAFEQVKQLFDPQGLMNPGKILAAAPMDSDLRYGTKYHDDPIETVYQYRDQRDFHTAVHQCSGIGSCRKVDTGTMCPSFMVTRDEEHSTRGRANALRLAMSGQLGEKGLLDDRLMEALDLCLSCKACKAECPSSVDMSRLKSEVLQMRYKSGGIPFRDRIVRNSAQMAAGFSGWKASVINGVQGTALFRNTIQSWLGFDHRRKLPKYANQSLVDWAAKKKRPENSRDRVVLFADTYCNHHETSVGKSAFQLLEKMGYQVELANGGCCQRPRISHGFLEDAKRDGEKTIDSLKEYFDQGLNVVVLEPSCCTALTNDLPDLITDVEKGERAQEFVIPIEKFVAQNLVRLLESGLKPVSDSVLLHGHCHQKALHGTTDIHTIFNAFGTKMNEPDTGCCGMAGSFGYEKEHFDISKKMAERVLLKEIAKMPGEAVIAASGFSCRHQVADLSEQKARHWVELFQ